MDEEQTTKELIQKAEDFVSERPNMAVLYLERACKSHGLDYSPIEARYSFTTEQAEKEIERIKEEIEIQE